jgi:hypothetical protein
LPHDPITPKVPTSEHYFLETKLLEDITDA